MAKTIAAFQLRHIETDVDECQSHFGVFIVNYVHTFILSATLKFCSVIERKREFLDKKGSLETQIFLMAPNSFLTPIIYKLFLNKSCMCRNYIFMVNMRSCIARRGLKECSSELKPKVLA